MWKIPQNFIQFDADSDQQDFWTLSPEPNKRKPTAMFTPS